MIRKRESVIRAIEECDRLGRKEFLRHYGYGKARGYFLVHEGKQYDSKAIAGVAYGFENPTEGALEAGQFSGGVATVQQWLEALGFEFISPGQSSERPRAFLFAWNPDKGPWTEFKHDLSMSKKGHVVSKRWSTGNRQDVLPGERVYLYRQARDQGLIAAGNTTSEVFMDEHWDGSGRQASYVEVDIDVILPITDVLTVEELYRSDVDVQWHRIQASGVAVPPASVGSLEERWRDHLVDLNRLTERMPEEVTAPTRYVEGAVRLVTVNAYERSAAARRDCIRRWGVNCAVCTFNFGDTYGDLGDGFIHVHHLRDLATIGEEYEVNPEEDLRPVCPNCHAMLHREVPAMSIEELKKRLSLLKMPS
jgi:5-methylcytosine-specific restriction enzyme A